MRTRGSCRACRPAPRWNPRSHLFFAVSEISQRLAGILYGVAVLGQLREEPGEEERGQCRLLSAFAADEDGARGALHELLPDLDPAPRKLVADHGAVVAVG